VEENARAYRELVSSNDHDQLPRVPVPQLPQARGTQPFPVLATIAPVLVSVAIWLVTQSPFALVFAALGPAVAIASRFDASLGAKKQWRSERSRFVREMELSRGQIIAIHDSERATRELDSPSSAARMSRDDHDPERWASAIENALVTVGRGRVPSDVEFELHPSHAEEHERLQELASFAKSLDNAPISVSAIRGVAIVGPEPVATSIARGIVIQCASLLSPANHECVVHDGDGEPWLAALPHAMVIDDSLARGEIRFRSKESRSPSANIVVSSAVDNVPASVRVVIQVGGATGASIVRHPDRSACGPFEPEFVSREQASAWARRLRSLAHRTGVVSTAETIPPVVPLAELLADLEPQRADRSTLQTAMGVSRDGTVIVDIVRDGPHAIVGGTTGSGKSELLTALVLGLAWHYSPDLVTFLLVDFKGGASFAPLSRLPHVVGMISDLDETGAARALSSLEAEVRFRERQLADAGARSINELPLDIVLPRLVIVVDEFASLVAGFPDLHALFADLAARGRSLGMHVVLCTQRPAGVVRDAVMANSGLRISLRVNNTQDSSAVIGSGAAAAIAPTAVGRALVSVVGTEPTELQVPLAGPSDAEAVTKRWSGFSPRKPWRDPLPAVLDVASLATSRAEPGVPIGRADLPHEQSQPVAIWDPLRDGHVIVVGSSRSGKSTALQTIGASIESAHIATAADPEAAWDAVVNLVARIRRGTGSSVLLIDDIDALLPRLSVEHATAFVDALSLVLREGPAFSVHVVLAAQRITPAVQSLSALCESRLLLRTATRQDHVLAGGVGNEWPSNVSPGGGVWRGHPVRIALGARRAAPAQRDTTVDIDPRDLIVVSSAAREFAEIARKSGISVTEVTPGATDPRHLDIGNSRKLIIGDPDGWQAYWGAVTTLGATTPVFFDRCSLADYRAITRSRSLPPPIVTSTGIGLVATPDGAVRRARINWPR
jgi:S-DNA-T family DNA segregation ATPase FtsK/SpoIIIE